jgi:hypothetical protein
MRAVIRKLVPAAFGMTLLGMAMAAAGLLKDDERLQVAGALLTVPLTAVFAVLLLAVVVGYAGVAAVTALAYCLAALRRCTRR